MAWEAELTELAASLRGHLLGALECAEACLQFATVASESTVGYTFNSAVYRALDVKDDIDKAVPLSGLAALHPRARGALAAALEVSSNAPLAAWYVADKIGRLCSQDYAAHMLDPSGRTDFELTDLAAYPVSFDACRAIYGGQRFSERASIDRQPFEPFVASGLALWRAGRHGPFRVRIDTQAGEAFNAALEEGGGLKIGLVQPNSEFSDLDVGKFTDGSEPDSRFFGVKPGDPAKQLEVIVTAVAEAEERDVGIILLPELVTTSEKADEFANSVATRGPKLQVIVGGSFHHFDVHGVQRNSTLVHFVNRFGGRRPADRVYTKSGAFYVDLTPKAEGEGLSPEIGATSGEPDLKFREDVEPSLEVRLYVGEAITVAVVICSDLLDRTLRHVLHRLGPSLVLVCNMTFKTEGFVDIAHDFIAEGQTTSVMVNNPGKWPLTAPDHVIVGMPLERDRVLKERFQYGEHLLVFDSREAVTNKPFLGRR